MPAHGRQQLLAGDGGGPARIAAGAAHAGQRLADQGRVAGAGSAAALGAQQRRLEQHAASRPARSPAPPGASTFFSRAPRTLPKRVAPGLDRVAMPRVAVEPDAARTSDRCRPAASPTRASRLARRCRLHAQQQRRVQQVVTVGEDVGRDQQLVADHPLDRMAPAVELRLDPLDDDRAARADRVRPRLVSGRAAVDRARAVAGRAAPGSAGVLCRVRRGRERVVVISRPAPYPIRSAAARVRRARPDARNRCRVGGVVSAP